MPLFTAELNRLTDDVVSADLTIYLHTAEPTDADPDNARITVGGGNYESGFALAASAISNASDGDASNNDDLAFGTADENLGTVEFASAYRGTTPVGYWDVPSTTVNANDTFTIPSGMLQFNGSTT